MPLILCGQITLMDKLNYHTAQALASRVAGRSHLEGLNTEGTVCVNIDVASN